MDQVVCIKEGEWESVGPSFRPITRNPVKGGVYTIVGVSTIEDHKYYSLAEMDDYSLWWAVHFRPVKKTDISQFTSRLKPINKTKKREKA